MPHPQQEFIDGLRAIADFIEARPSIEAPGVFAVNIFAQDRAAFDRIAPHMGACEKRTIGDYFYLHKPFGLFVALELNAPRDQVCTRVKVGERIIEATPEITVPAKPERVEEIWEWECPKSILATKAETVQESR